MMRTPSAGTEETSSPRWLGVLELIPLAWIGIVGYAYGVLAFTPTGEDRMAVPGIALAEQAVVPLLCLIGVAAIIRYVCLRNGQAPLSPARGEGQDTL